MLAAVITGYKSMGSGLVNQRRLSKSHMLLPVSDMIVNSSPGLVTSIIVWAEVDILSSRKAVSRYDSVVLVCSQAY